MRKPDLQNRTGRLGWEDLRTVLAVARTGSLSGAARELGVEHSTVFRRIEDLERRLGDRLFERSRSGYAANANGELVAEAARSMEEAALAAERRVLGADARLTGVVRIATSELFAAYLLTRVLGDLLAGHPELQIEVDVSNQVVDLTRREADVAIRATNAPPGHLIGQKVAELRYAVFAAPGLVPGNRTPVLAELPWVGVDESLADIAIARWLRTTLPEVRPRLRFDSLMALMQAVSNGLGAAILPVFVASLQPGLSRISEILDQPRMSIWVLSHRDVRQNARVRAVSQHLTRHIPQVVEDLHRKAPCCKAPAKTPGRPRRK